MNSFGAFLAPLTKDKFKEVVTDVEQKLQVVHQTLSMLDSLLDAQGFDALLEEMLRAITLKTSELLNADRTTIYLLDEDKNELWAIFAQDEQNHNLELRLPATVGIAGEVATKREVVNTPYDFYDDHRSEAARKFDEKNSYRTYTMLTMPILNESGALVAVVQLLNKLKQGLNPDVPLDEKIDRDGFTSRDEQVYEEFAHSIRLIIESSLSFYRAAQQQRATSALMKATKSLSQSSLDLQETLNKVMDEAQELMQADRSTLWLVDRECNQLWTKIQINGELMEIRIPVGADFAGQVAATGEPIIIPFDLYDDPNSQISKETDLKTGYRTCSTLCMPVFNTDGELIGVTQLINKKRLGDYPPYDPAHYPEAPECWRASFNRNDQEFMQAFNIQAGIALQNAKLFETTRQQEQMQRNILRSLTNGVISTDKKGVITVANETAKQLFGLEETEVIQGKHIRNFIQLEKGDFPKWFDMALEAKDDKSRQQYYPDQSLQPLRGSEKHSVNISISTLTDMDDHNKSMGALVVLEDISSEKLLKSTMYRYMTQELAEQLLENADAAKMGGARRDVAVLISDIRNYSTLTEHLLAEEVVEMLNEYFEQMIAVLFEYKGTLDKYISSKIVAVFGAPLPLAAHELMAVQAASGMQEKLINLNENRLRKGKEPIQMNVGITSGSVIVGNIGSSQRMEFTSTGDPVNLAEYLLDLGKKYDCSIAIDGGTYQACRERISVRELEIVRTKNECSSIYELLNLDVDCLSSKTKKFVKLYQAGRDFYYDRKFKEAIPYFEAAQQIRPQDKTTEIYLCRARGYLDHSPPNDWDGSQKLN